MNPILFHACGEEGQLLVTEEGQMVRKATGEVLHPERMNVLMMALNFDEQLGKELQAAIERAISTQSTTDVSP